MEFGVPHSLVSGKKTAHQFKEIQQTDTFVPSHTEPKKRQGGTWTPIDNLNTAYMEQSPRNPVNFVSHNVDLVRAKSVVNSKNNVKMKMIACEGDVGHNYSSSTMNSTEMAKRKIREVLSEQPKERFTYSQHYASQTVSPRTVAEEAEKEAQERTAKWRTSGGFVFPGHRTALLSNQHGSLPHYTRVEQLREPWEENVLHTGKLKPTVDWKTFSWNERSSDFMTPQKIPAPSHPVTIHLAGKRRAEEVQQYASLEGAKWRSKLVVDNEQFAVHRTAPAVELKSMGVGAATQQDKAGSILKDKPAKLSLAAPGLKLAPIPTVSVVNYPKSEAQELRVFAPGPHSDLSWARENNAIPLVRGGETDGKFSLYFTPHTALSRLAIKPLGGEEKVGHLWGTPAS